MTRKKSGWADEQGEPTPEPTPVAANGDEVLAAKVKARGTYAEYLCVATMRGDDKQVILCRVANRYRAVKWWTMASVMVGQCYTNVHWLKCRDRSSEVCDG